MDTSTYQPAAHVLDKLAQVDFVAVIGPTSVGKTTVIKAAMDHEPQIHLVLNNTTRAPRAGEQDGVDYLFQTREVMEARIAKGEYVQVAPSILGELYATAPEGFAADGVAVMAVLADAIPLFRTLPFKRMRTLFIIPPDWPTWQQRLTAHGFTPDQLLQRLDEARRSLQFALDDAETQIIINQDLTQATNDFIALTFDRPLPTRLQDDQIRARDVVRNLLSQLPAAA